MHTRRRRTAYYGGTFDPVHLGHLTVATRLLDLFELDEFAFLPAYHAPHKPDSKPTSAYHRYAMLCLATEDEPRIKVSQLELETGEKRYTIDTLGQLKKLHAGETLFFVMGADSWADILTWRRWEGVLLSTNHIVVTRPGYEIETGHVTDAVRERIVDLRGRRSNDEIAAELKEDDRIYFTDAVNFDVSATEIRDDVRADAVLDRTDDVPVEVAKYIEKYDLYR
jgi:nicotinate-nucleotide adenylyltransferase